MADFRSSDSIKSIAARNGISQGVATKMFGFVSYGNPKLPKVLSIDEFKGNAGRKYQCILADPVHKKVLDILPNRLTTELKNHFLNSYTLDQRKNVEYFVMDMSGQFAEIIQFCFPNAKIVIDKFHVSRHVLWALEKKRKEMFLRAYSTGYTNGFTEGCNNRIKVLKRNCYGVRNFNRFRNRILHMIIAASYYPRLIKIT